MAQHVNKKIKISSLKKGDSKNVEADETQNAEPKKSEPKHIKSESKKSEPKEAEVLEPVKESFEIVDTTSINDNGESRQEIYRKIFNIVAPFKSYKIRFEQYTYEGEDGPEDAISILANGSEIGNIGNDDLKRFSDIAASITGASLEVRREKDENKHNYFCAKVTFECGGEDNGTIDRILSPEEIKYEKVDEATMKRVIKSYKSNLKFIALGLGLLVLFCLMKSWIFAAVLVAILGFFVFSTIKMHRLIKRNKEE